jgi:lysophospholipase
MHRIWSPILAITLCLILPACAIPVDIRDASKPYAPFLSDCPTNVLLTRPANSISEDEALYSIKRKAKASIALTAWLKRIDPSLPTSNLPTIGLSTSGGGYRSLLTGAGILRAFDGREDTHLATSGLLQSLTYSSSLSGGAWLTSSVGGNGFPTISSLQNGLWKKAFQSPFFIPVEEGDPLQAYREILTDINSKTAVGFQATITDLW